MNGLRDLERLQDALGKRLVMACDPELKNDLPLPPDMLPTTRHMGMGFPEVSFQRLAVHAGGRMTCNAAAVCPLLEQSE